MSENSLTKFIARVQQIWSPLSTELISACQLQLAELAKAPAYRPPHDHGRSWVMYALQKGESEMRSYAQIKKDDGTVKLVRRDTTLVASGRVMVYLPGDIHDTRCVSGPSLLFRFTERDLHLDDNEGHKVTRYVEKDGDWTLANNT
jgi:hypothetical protein